MGEEIAIRWSFSEIERAASYIVKSRLFGVQRVEEAVSLMLLSHSRGVHPMQAVMEYHIINGRPAMRADAMLARFQQAGGKVEWHELSHERAEATFSHPQGGSVRIAWTLEDAKRAGLLGRKDSNWEKYPRAMLRARVISEGVRTVYPAVAVGLYTPEEVMDFAPPPAVEEARVVVTEALPPYEGTEEDPPQGGPEPARPTGGEQATEPQLRAIATIAGKLGEEPHRAAGRILGREVASLKDLTKKEASRVIEALKEQAAQGGAAPRPAPEKLPRPITGDQAAYIKSLTDTLGLSREEAREVASRFVGRALETVRGISEEEALALIQYLEALLESGGEEAGERLREWLGGKEGLPEPIDIEGLGDF